MIQRHSQKLSQHLMLLLFLCQGLKKFCLTSCPTLVRNLERKKRYSCYPSLWPSKALASLVGAASRKQRQTFLTLLELICPFPALLSHLSLLCSARLSSPAELQENSSVCTGTGFSCVSHSASRVMIQGLLLHLHKCEQSHTDIAIVNSDRVPREAETNVMLYSSDNN